MNLTGILIVAGCEAVAALIFYLLARWNSNGQKKGTISLRSLLKGWVERAFLVFALVSGYPQALTLFAALKIATRIKDDQPISNDFYLLGNLVSVSLAILYAKIVF
jgi:hypothetical protein